MKLSQTSGVPIYQQIAEAFRTDILSGKMKQGEYLPSIRGLAKELKISVITTMKAYELLEEEGLVTAMQGKGFQVNTQDNEMLREQQMRRVENSINDAIKAARNAGIEDEELREIFDTMLSIKE
ncbi:MAG: GntR family transcriptional regulator [Lachnospiraceae bacterium]|nr:GntR family transcriptional regulator [Lachnospiraceae bacterium]MDD6191561.1 GntR family transcriptional regulator [Lachnospiraceae bacterium]MDY4792761.1 GntR family transcriptional regulator [Pararoseburia sp.]